MSSEDWYRNTEWNDEIKQAFFARLKRSRSQRDQNLEIQAGTLLPTHPEVALELIDLYFETRKESFTDARAHDVRAEAHLRLGNIPGAIVAFKDALAHERKHPTFLTHAIFDFAMLVATHKITSEYDDALAGLQARGDRLHFPAHIFEWHAAHSIILEDRGELDQAAEHAQVALEAAQRTESPFSYHRDLGLVEPKSAPIVEVLQQICARAGRAH